MGQYRGQKKPDFADLPGPGQESVWDYPRPGRFMVGGLRMKLRARLRVNPELLTGRVRIFLRLTCPASPRIPAPPPHQTASNPAFNDSGHLRIEFIF